MSIAAMVAFLSLILMVWVGVRTSFFSNLEYENAKASLGDISYAADIACGMGSGNSQLATVKVGGNLSFEETGRICFKYPEKTVCSSINCRFSPRSLYVKPGDVLVMENNRGLITVRKSDSGSGK